MAMNIRTQQAAAHLGLSKSTLDKLRHFGGGPRYFKLGRAVVYSVSDLDRWMSERSRRQTWGQNDNVQKADAA